LSSLSELPSSSDENLGCSKLMFSSLSVFSEVDISPSFYLPLLLLEEALVFGVFNFFFYLSSKKVIIFLK